jgi:hypothetical protein
MRLVGVCLFKVKRQLLALIFAPLHLEILEEREREGGGCFLKVEDLKFVPSRELYTMP